MLITFEGIDASGKTTQMAILAKTLIQKGFQVLQTRQPGGTTIGQLIRQILLNPQHIEMIPETEVLLYVADRVQHIKEVIEPALSEGRIVLCDRYHDATVAYQGSGRQLDLAWLKPLEERLIRPPDLTLWFDIPVEESQIRLQKRNKTQNVENCRLEREDDAFFSRIREAYESFARQQGHRFVKVDAMGEISDVQERIVPIVMSRLRK